MGIKKSNEQFISEVSEIFKDRPYSFEKVVYTGARDYVTATCLIHGDWSVMATNLLGGKGCRGVSFDKHTQKYNAYIYYKYVQHNLGFFSTLEEAVEARKLGEKKFWNHITE